MFKTSSFKEHIQDIYLDINNEIRISNTYPVKLKINDLGIYGFNSRLTLVENIKNLYLNRSYYQMLKQIGMISIEVIHSKSGEEFLFLKSPKDLILLNYISNDEVFNPNKGYYVPQLSHYQTKHHIASIKFYPYFNFTEYKIINLRDAFKPFPLIKHYYIEKNNPLFGNFIESLLFYKQFNYEEKEYNCIDEVLNTNKPMHEWIFTNHRFYYYLIDNVYIISDYK